MTPKEQENRDDSKRADSTAAVVARAILFAILIGTAWFIVKSFPQLLGLLGE